MPLVYGMFANVWPLILMITVILSTMRITWFIKTKNSFIWYQEIFYLVFIIYIICLFHLVTFQDVSWSTSNFLPFKEIMRYEYSSPMFFKNVIGNLLIFIPFGFLVSYILDLTKVRSIFFITVIISLTIEITQLIIGRVFDIDDIMLNILGSILGFGMYLGFKYFKKYALKH